MNWVRFANRVADAVLYRYSVLVVPLLIGVMTLVALAAWDNQYAANRATGIPFRFVSELGAPLAPAQASALLDRGPLVDHHDTRLSEAPV